MLGIQLEDNSQPKRAFRGNEEAIHVRNHHRRQFTETGISGRNRETLAMAFADILNNEARQLEAAGVDLIQFDEPAFNVFMEDVKEWGIEALHRAIEGLSCLTAVHICYGYGIEENLRWKDTLGGEWRQYEDIFPALNDSRIDQVSLECADSRVPLSLMGLLKDKGLVRKSL
ncbi:5-methyltetrahydropteroyltriglutamate--homocysteine methyltransferase (EC [Olavius algarvensis Delta 1 endosymbiont]|nr:5-methyltetrahydropteroyltriglutamate--homocysteine methyltransferase (EC [Olavius algarvensis Delta 1 endosymbiont]